MDTKDLVILANSRRHNGHCIAGKDLKTGEWIRPINILGRDQTRLDPSAFLEDPDFSFLMGDLRGPQLLECIRIGVGERCGDYCQPENQYIDGNPWTRLYTYPHQKIPELLDGPSTLFIGKDDHFTDSLPAQEIVIKPLRHSLNFVRISRDSNKTEIIHTKSFSGNPQHRLRFEYETKIYNLVITDYAYEHLANESKNDDNKIFQDCYVTIGVGEIYRPEIRNVELHYRLIVGIIPVSSLR